MAHYYKSHLLYISHLLYPCTYSTGRQAQVRSESGKQREETVARLVFNLWLPTRTCG